eukprot:3879387-Amphidinium_carterae.1
MQVASKFGQKVSDGRWPSGFFGFELSVAHYTISRKTPCHVAQRAQIIEMFIRPMYTTAVHWGSSDVQNLDGTAVPFIKPLCVEAWRSVSGSMCHISLLAQCDYQSSETLAMAELSQEVEDLLYGEGNFNFLDEFNTQGSQFENLSQDTLGLGFDGTQGTQTSQRDEHADGRGLEPVVSLLDQTTADLKFDDLDDMAEDFETQFDPKNLPEYACRYCGIHDPACVMKSRGDNKWFCNGRLPGLSPARKKCALTNDI